MVCADYGVCVRIYYNAGYVTAHKDQTPIPNQFLLSCLQPIGEPCSNQFGYLFASCSLPAFAPLGYPFEVVALRVECPRFRVCSDVAFHVWYELLTTLHQGSLRILSVTGPSMSRVAFWGLLRAVQDASETLNLDRVDIFISYGLLRSRGFGFVLPKRKTTIDLSAQSAEVRPRGAN